VSRARAENLGRRMWRVLVGRQGPGVDWPPGAGQQGQRHLGASDRQGPSAGRSAVSVPLPSAVAVPLPLSLSSSAGRARPAKAPWRPAGTAPGPGPVRYERDRAVQRSGPVQVASNAPGHASVDPCGRCCGPVEPRHGTGVRGCGRAPPKPGPRQPQPPSLPAVVGIHQAKRGWGARGAGAAALAPRIHNDEHAKPQTTKDHGEVLEVSG
jgi:hypothetical protein